MIAASDIPPIIAVMPDMPSSERASYYVDLQYTGTDYPAEPVETAFFSDLIPHIDATYRTIADRNGRLIGGYSMGGYGAIRYGWRIPTSSWARCLKSGSLYTAAARRFEHARIRCVRPGESAI